MHVLNDEVRVLRALIPWELSPC